jgi:carbonic anhydrase
MSCPSATAPIDISVSNVKGKCQMKCSYTFSYKTSSCTATNRGDYISISYDKSSNHPVMYNAVGYDVQEIRIYTPSLHSFNGNKTDAELIVVHSSVMGADPLLVCLPIQKNNSTSVSSMFFKTLLDTMASSAPSEGESASINVPKFSLSSFIPKKPFYSYTGTEPYQPCSSQVDYIVYSPIETSLDITSDSLEKLKTIISKNVYDIKKGPNLFYNEKGPGNEGITDDIYIDCQPVGESEEQTEIILSTSSDGLTMKDIVDNTFFKIFLGVAIFIFLLFGLKYVLSKIQTGGLQNIFKTEYLLNK